MKYKLKAPTEVEAIKLEGHNAVEVCAWVNDQGGTATIKPRVNSPNPLADAAIYLHNVGKLLYPFNSDYVVIYPGWYISVINKEWRIIQEDEFETYYRQADAV